MAEFDIKEIVNGIASFIKQKVPYQPDILIMCGSGLGPLCSSIEQPITLEYKDIPNFPTSTVQGHGGKLIFGTLANVKIVCMSGRFHYYEGYTLHQCTIPIRVLSLLGARLLIVTNAAGAVNPDYKVGDLMLIKDQINFLGLGGTHPLRGPNDESIGPRFFPMNKAYSKCLRKHALTILKRVGLAEHSHEGVYAMVGGPNYETIAEVKMLRVVGVDAVGMSTVPEVLVAKHAGMSILGFSMIANVCVSDYDDESQPNHEEVLAMMNARNELVTKFLTELIKSIGPIKR